MGSFLRNERDCDYAACGRESNPQGIVSRSHGFGAQPVGQGLDLTSYILTYQTSDPSRRTEFTCFGWLSDGPCQQLYTLVSSSDSIARRLPSDAQRGLPLNMKPPCLSRVKVRSPARIHCALVNESGEFDRVDGGVGFALSNPFWEIEVAINSGDTNLELVEDEHRCTVASVIDRFRAKFAFDGSITVNVRKSIPLHVGLGSKTSLTMGLGWAITRLFGVNWDARQIGTFLGRGGTSGIGVHAFFEGGFIWDVGRKFPEIKDRFGPSSECLAPAPEKALAIIPDDLLIVHFRFNQRGLSGSKEKHLFKGVCPVDPDQTRRIMLLLAGQLIPSIVDQDEQGIQCSIRKIQQLGLKRVEWETQDKETLRFREYWDSVLPDVALGLSSMGPTMYCITRDVSRIISAITAYDTTPIHITTSKLYKGLRVGRSRRLRTHRSDLALELRSNQGADLTQPTLLSRSIDPIGRAIGNSGGNEVNSNSRVDLNELGDIGRREDCQESPLPLIGFDNDPSRTSDCDARQGIARPNLEGWQAGDSR
jgi:beta-ribofuranosylaminobenzene 5'-phosphate synthase